MDRTLEELGLICMDGGTVCKEDPDPMPSGCCEDGYKSSKSTSLGAYWTQMEMLMERAVLDDQGYDVIQASAEQLTGATVTSIAICEEHRKQLCKLEERMEAYEQDLHNLRRLCIKSLSEK